MSILRKTFKKLGFTCPFHQQGENEGRILDIELNGDAETRISAMVKGLHEFYKHSKLFALRFTLAQELIEGCDSVETLGERIFPLQFELFAAELDCRLYPFLSYHSYGEAYGDAAKQELLKATAYQLMFTMALENEGLKPPESALEVALFVQRQFEQALGHHPDPILTWSKDVVEGAEPKEENPLLTIRRGSLALGFEVPNETTTPETNRNLYTIVTCPFYPPEFGRFSEKVSLVMTREAHYYGLTSEEGRKRIRFDSNSILRKHGVVVADLAEGTQNLWLWSPKFVSASVPKEKALA